MATIELQYHISRNQGFWCQVNWTFQSPDPRISDGLSPSQLLQIWWLSAFWEIWMGSNGHWISVFLPINAALLFIAIVITATTTVLAINDKYTLICCLLTEFSNNLPLWHWWQHLHSDSTLLCIRPFRLSSAFGQSGSTLFPKPFELDSFLPLWHQCQRGNILPLILLLIILPLSSRSILGISSDIQ